MPAKSPILPASFLQACEEARTNPYSFISKNGQVKYLPFIGGAADDDAGKQEDDGDGQSGANAGTSGTDDGKSPEPDGDEEDGQESLPDNIKDIIRKNRAERREAQREAERARRAAEEAQAKVKQYEDRDKSELERAVQRAEEAEKRAAALEESNQRLSLRSAFLSVQDVEWVDPEDALEMALRKFGLGDLEVSESGSVNEKALQKIVKQMADDKPYLVKKETAGDGARPSGAAFNGGRNSNKKATDEAALKAKYPAMSGRRKIET